MITTKGDNYECTEKSLFIKLFVEHFTDCDLDRDRPWRSRWNLDQ